MTEQEGKFRSFVRRLHRLQTKSLSLDCLSIHVMTSNVGSLTGGIDMRNVEIDCFVWDEKRDIKESLMWRVYIDDPKERQEETLRLVDEFIGQHVKRGK